jgi:hypothetical protein
MANNDKPTSPNQLAREAKLAKALRDNLKRRKASARESGAPKPPAKPPADQDR